MIMKLDKYTVHKLFMKRIPPAMRNAILEDHLWVELNTLDELVLSGKAWEDTEWSKKEYASKDVITRHKSGNRASRSKDQSKPFSGMKMFLHPKGSHQYKNNLWDTDHSRPQFSANEEKRTRECVPHPQPMNTPIKLVNLRYGITRLAGDTSHLTCYTCRKKGCITSQHHSWDILQMRAVWSTMGDDIQYEEDIIIERED